MMKLLHVPFFYSLLVLLVSSTALSEEGNTGSYSETTTTEVEESGPNRPLLRPLARPDDLDPANYVVDHECSLIPCTRTAILNYARNKGTCQDHILEMACRFSPWRDDSIRTRFRNVIDSIKRINEIQGWDVDPNAMLCIFAKEGAGLEPLMLSFSSCARPTSATDTGLGQTIASTTGDMLCRTGFASKVPAFQNFKCTVSEKKYLSNSSNKKSVAYQSGIEYVNKMPAYPDAQIEMSMQVLRSLSGGRNSNFKEHHFRNYNGSDKRYSYGRSVNSCYNKLKGHDPYSNFDRLNSYKPIEKQYNDIQKRCSRPLNESKRPLKRPRRGQPTRPNSREEGA